MRARTVWRYVGVRWGLITVAEDDRCERLEADEVARRHTWAHNGRKGLPL